MKNKETRKVFRNNQNKEKKNGFQGQSLSYGRQDKGQGRQRKIKFQSNLKSSVLNS